MLFSSNVFLYFYFPIVLALYYLTKGEREIAEEHYFDFNGVDVVAATIRTEE
mgnify:CR=1 FL=1